MWWFLFKAGLVIFLLVIVFGLMVYMLGSDMVSQSLNKKIEGDIRINPDVKLEEQSIEDQQDEQLDQGYMSD